jgi:hypothetical protein
VADNDEDPDNDGNNNPTGILVDELAEDEESGEESEEEVDNNESTGVPVKSTGVLDNDSTGVDNDESTGVPAKSTGVLDNDSIGVYDEIVNDANNATEDHEALAEAETVTEAPEVQGAETPGVTISEEDEVGPNVEFYNPDTWTPSVQ